MASCPRITDAAVLSLVDSAALRLKVCLAARRPCWPLACPCRVRPATVLQAAMYSPSVRTPGQLAWSPVEGFHTSPRAFVLPPSLRPDLHGGAERAVRERDHGQGPLVPPFQTLIRC